MQLSEENALFQVTSDIEPSFQKTVIWAETLLIESKGKGNGTTVLKKVTVSYLVIASQSL